MVRKRHQLPPKVTLVRTVAKAILLNCSGLCHDYNVQMAELLRQQLCSRLSHLSTAFEVSNVSRNWIYSYVISMNVGTQKSLE
jgi:hypothetical protein